MKRLIAAAVLCVCMLLICVAEQLVSNSFENECDRFIASIKNARKSGNSAVCEKNINQLIHHFNKSEPLLIIFTNKSIIDDMECSIYRLSDYSKSDDDAMFLGELSVLETEISELKRSSGFSLESIF